MQRKAIPDHLKKNTESHLKLACERLQQLQDSSTLATASIQEVQTEMVTAMTKIKELSEEVRKSADLQDARNNTTATWLSSLKVDVETTKTKVAELTEELSSTDEWLSEVKDDVNKLQELNTKVDSLQGLRGVVCVMNTDLQKLQEAFTRMEKTNSDRDRKILSEIDYAKRVLRHEFEAELQDISQKAEENRRLLETIENRWETFKKFIRSIFWIAVFVLCIRYGTFTYLYLLIKSIF